MAIEVLMPRLGWDMKVGSVAEWLKRDGEDVAAGDVICTISGDKATTELEAPESGTLRLAPDVPEIGQEVPVGTVLAYLVHDNEAMPAPVRSDAPPRQVASPRARRAAAARGLDWRTLNGSGRGGRILERDVSAALIPDQVSAPTPEPLAGIRRLTAERVAASAHAVAPVTLTTEADATSLVRLRKQAQCETDDSSAPVPSYTALLVKITAIALREHPMLNAQLTPGGIIEHARANIAIAVDTPQGLLAPVIPDAGARSVDSIARESLRLIDLARKGTIGHADLTGATFTITNLGHYEIDAFTPIVNLPQCAILGLGRIVPRPVVVDESTDRVEVRRMLTLSLTVDHRLVDGAPAARFLQRIKHLVERPTTWLFR